MSIDPSRDNARWDDGDRRGPRDDVAGTIGASDLSGGRDGWHSGLPAPRGVFRRWRSGDQVRATGWVSEFHGETQIEVSGTGASRIAVSGRGMSLAPRRLRTGEIGEAHEGRLTWVFGRVIRASASGVTLNDGSGPAYIYFPEDLPWQHPYVKLGDMWGAQGVVGQYASQAPYTDGYRLIPRLASDFSQRAALPAGDGCGFPITRGLTDAPTCQTSAPTILLRSPAPGGDNLRQIGCASAHRPHPVRVSVLVWDLASALFPAPVA